MNEKLVTIAKFTDYIEADLARQTLDDFEIKSIVTGQNAANILPIPAVAEIELQVFEGQAEQALEILQSQNKQEQ